MKFRPTFLLLILVVILYSACKKEDVSTIRNAEKPGSANLPPVVNVTHKPTLLANLVSGKYIVSGYAEGDNYSTILKDTFTITACNDSNITINPPNPSTTVYEYFLWSCISYTPSQTQNRVDVYHYNMTTHNNGLDVYFPAMYNGSLKDSIYISAQWIGGCGGDDGDEELILSGVKIQ